ncbi:LegC family aminotransferase [Pseudoalteromonas xiamenensis]|uniref:LegC family aminotransferase n=1 Tax=Pseudoalteromonas xiamenensis TaxID=882626 RepID=UPI0027E526D0|nr:LegC family aminotransferase [Pseudoalteromonas xiamenensis]WMN61493.1 LegC family aminotransferase [Pseudoalteromonas xiamenensis]
MVTELIEFIREQYSSSEFIPLHQPYFSQREKDYVIKTIESTFVSSVGQYVDLFEQNIESYSGCAKAVATVNGTSALLCALYAAGIERNDVVITQALTFVATCNAIVQLGAAPAFVDVSANTLGLSPDALQEFLIENAYLDGEHKCRLKKTKQVVRAVVPMHTFGHPVEIDRISQICRSWNIALVEDAAESLGSFYKGKHTGTFGDYGAVSFNGNKIITTGGGGAILCQSKDTGKRIKHLTTTAKVQHQYEYYHDEIGFNFRLPNINAALGCAQMEKIEMILLNKRELANEYRQFFSKSEYKFVNEPLNCRSNYWLNAIICPDESSKKYLLETTNQHNVMTRPIWTLMNELPMFSSCMCGRLSVSQWLAKHVVNLPSSVRM